MVLTYTVVAFAEDTPLVEGEATISVVDEKGNTQKYTFDISELMSIEYDAEGNVVPDSRLGLSKHSIKQGEQDITIHLRAHISKYQLIPRLPLR